MGEQEKIDQDKITAEEGIVPAEEIDDELVPNNGSDAEDQVVLRIQAELAHVNYLDLLHEYQNTLAEFKDLLEQLRCENIAAFHFPNNGSSQTMIIALLRKSEECLALVRRLIEHATWIHQDNLLL